MSLLDTETKLLLLTQWWPCAPPEPEGLPSQSLHRCLRPAERHVGLPSSISWLGWNLHVPAHAAPLPWVMQVLGSVGS